MVKQLLDWYKDTSKIKDAEEQNLIVYLNGEEHYNLEFEISEYNNEILILKKENSSIKKDITKLEKKK